MLRRALAETGPRAYATALVAALLLAVPDLGRQLLVRDDPSRLHALLVDVVGVLSAAVVQLALVGLLNGRQRWLRHGTGIVLDALRIRPGTLLLGLVAAGAVSAVLTLPVSVAALGAGQVLGPLRDPSLGALLVAQASDVVATAVTGAWFAVFAGLCAQRTP